MSLRIFSAGFLFTLSACGGGPPDTVAPADPANRLDAGSGTPAGEAAETISCATGTAAFAPDCTVERAAADGGTLVTIRHPDGGFRRLRITPGGGVQAADGALPAAVTLRDGVAEVAVGDARYRLPLTAP